ncbi:MAG: protoglobin domain-containing protein [Myxococcota bacterium]
MADVALFFELKADVGFDDRAAGLLADAKAVVEDSFGSVVDEFYDVIEANPRARAVFRDRAQIERQKTHLRGWLATVFSGEYDEAFFLRRARIGRTHVHIGLDQHYMFSMMNVLRRGLAHSLHRGATSAGWTPERIRDTENALHALLDLELAIMLETYREDFVGKMRRTEQLATVGQVAATIGHELRNPLAVIDSSVHLLGRRAGDDPRVRKHIDRIGRQVSISNQIITNLLSLARDREVHRRQVSLADLVSDALSGTPGAERIHVEVQVAEIQAHVDGAQLRQVLVNLLQNALDAGATQVRIQGEQEAGVLRVSVEDDGRGIPEEVMGSLFEPLFTTKANGTGLGLAYSRRVLEKHGGSIRAASLPNGTCIELEIPAEA